MQNLKVRHALAFMLAAGASPAFAAEPQAYAVHGFGSVQVSNDYITPRGLLVTDEGLTSQALVGLVFPVPGSGAIVVGIWNDFNFYGARDASNHHPDPWNETDWFAGYSVTLNKTVKLGAKYVAFVSPPGVFKAEHNIELSAAYDDSLSHASLSLQPYAKLFWGVAGDSTVVLGAHGGTFDIELGAMPTLRLKRLPVTVTMPTWITVGPSRFWCQDNSACGKNNFGVFSTGLTAKAQGSLVPMRYGRWFLYAGFQYYNLLNRGLVSAQALTVGSPQGHRNVINELAGLGFDF